MNKKLLNILVLLAALVGMTSVAFASTVTGTISSGIGSGGSMNSNVPYIPSASVASGTYHATQNVSLTSSGATSIRYTTDGTTPTCSSGTVYASAVAVTQSLTLKAVACQSSAASSVASFDYVLNCATSSVANGSVGAYPSCSITCNTGYTLSGGSCVSSGGSHTTGGGGGGGGGASPTPTPTTPTVPQTTLNTLIAALQALLAQAHSQGLITTSFANQVLGSIGGTSIGGLPTTPQVPTPTITTPFTQPLLLGSQGAEVTRLQTFLKSQGSTIYPEGLVTGYFGQATLRAVQRFQELYNIAHVGDVGYGFVGPATRAKINALLGL
ncbi:MAG: chitobiase/beta-hexosaminidase C-terminal domain-containing protein [Patescibacteria group bacterium]|nr:chitobiase/beta-hexosaminidase C-terminal domain-containing protein [Patescibacteria group bacterium]